MILAWNFCSSETDPTLARSRDSAEDNDDETADRDDGEDEETNDDNQYGADAAAGECTNADQKKKMDFTEFHYTADGMLPTLRLPAPSKALLDSLYTACHQLLGRACIKQAPNYKESSAINHV